MKSSLGTFLLLFSFLSTYSQVNLQDSLVAHYPLNGNALDISGNGNHGTANGATLTTDRFGTPNSAYLFDGVDDFIDLLANQKFKPQLPVTISAWIELRSYDLNMVFKNEFVENNYTGVWLNSSGGTIQSGFGDGGLVSPFNRRSKRGTTVLPQFVWAHVAVVIRGSLDMDIYINGKNDCGTYSGSGSNLVYSSLNGNLGRSDANSAPGPLNWFDGKIDEVRFYNRVLNAEEIRALAETTNLETANLCQGESTNLNATDVNAVSYQWSPTIGLSCSNCSNPTASPLDTTLYQLIRRNSASCPDTFYYQVNVQDCSISVCDTSFTLQDSLVAHYPMNGNLLDVSGNGNHGTANGPILTMDRLGNPNEAYQFDGVDDFIDLLPNQKFKPQLPVTISAWVELANHDINMIFKNDTEIDRYRGVWLNNVDGVVSAAFGDGGLIGPSNRRTKRGTTVIPTFIWTHVAVVIRGSLDMDIYINGRNDCGTYTGSGGPLSYSSGNGSMGRQDSTGFTGPFTWFKGKIDEVRFYNRELCLDEIWELADFNDLQTVNLCSGDSTSLDANDDSSTYSWSPVQDLSCSNCPNPIASPTDTTLYQVIRDNGFFCLDTMYYQVNVENCIPPCDTTFLEADFTYTTNGLVLTGMNAARGPDSGIDRWRWDFGDGSRRTIFQPDTINHQYSQPGTYEVCLMVEKAYDELNVCLDTFCQEVMVDSIANGFGEDLLEIGWDIYPNPSVGTIYLQKAEPTGFPIEVEIFSQEGKSLFREVYVSQTIIEIPILSLPSGMYIISLADGGIKGFKKIIKI